MKLNIELSDTELFNLYTTGNRYGHESTWKPALDGEDLENALTIEDLENDANY